MEGCGVAGEGPDDGPAMEGLLCRVASAGHSCHTFHLKGEFIYSLPVCNSMDEPRYISKELSWMQKDKYCMTHLSVESKKSHTHSIREQKGGAPWAAGWEKTGVSCWSKSSGLWS